MLHVGGLPTRAVPSYAFPARGDGFGGFASLPAYTHVSTAGTYGVPATYTVTKKSKFNRAKTADPEPKITVGAGMMAMTLTFNTSMFAAWQEHFDAVEAAGDYAGLGIVSTLIGEIETAEKDVSVVTVMHIFPRNETTDAIFDQEPAALVGGANLPAEGIILGDVHVAYTNVTSGIDRMGA
jgi:hypothetical protein